MSEREKRLELMRLSSDYREAVLADLETALYREERMRKTLEAIAERHVPDVAYDGYREMARASLEQG